MNFPRVLHVGFNPIGSQSNTGLTLANMFAGWPLEKLFELYTPSRQTRSIDGSRHVVVAPRSTAPVDGAIRQVLGRRLPEPIGDGLNSSVSRRATGASLRTRARAAATALNDVGPVWVRGDWLGSVDSFDPEVIHSLLGGVRVTKLVAALARRYEVPVVPHFMDDWPANIYEGGQLFGFPRRQALQALQSVLERAPVCLTIGQDMQAEFEERFGVPCAVVGNSAELSSGFGSVASRRPCRGGPSVLRYMGGLHLGRDVALMELARVLKEERKRLQARLVVHAPPSDAGRLSRIRAHFPDVVEAGPTVVPSEVLDVLAASDVLVFVESSIPAIVRFTRLSVSTKVPEYLAARRPVLALGPPEQSSIRALKCGPATRHVQTGSSEAIADAVEASLVAARVQLPELSEELSSLFDREATQERLRAALAEAVLSGRQVH